MILICFGTRPEYIKIKPLLKAFDGKMPYKLLFTGQHKDLLSHVKGDIRRLEIKDGKNRLDSIVSSNGQEDSSNLFLQTLNPLVPQQDSLISRLVFVCKQLLITPKKSSAFLCLA